MCEATPIQEVWAGNLDKEISRISEIIEKYPYLSMDTEFPGTVTKPIGKFKDSTDFTYQCIRCNVDLLNIIQLGITFSDSAGNLPQPTCTWQFNFKFSIENDMYSQESVDLLEKAGIDFKKNFEYGINLVDFGDLLTTSGLVLNENIYWVSFHGGYDFAYMLKLLTCDSLPVKESEFFEQLNLFFPNIYDIKYLIKSCKNLKGGLQEISDDLKITRIGIQHQAGSDSLLTSMVFFKLKANFFDNSIEDKKFLGILYGLNPKQSSQLNILSLSQFTAPDSTDSVLSTSIS